MKSIWDNTATAGTRLPVRRMTLTGRTFPKLQVLTTVVAARHLLCTCDHFARRAIMRGLQVSPLLQLEIRAVTPTLTTQGDQPMRRERERPVLDVGLMRRTPDVHSRQRVNGSSRRSGTSWRSRNASVRPRGRGRRGRSGVFLGLPPLLALPAVGHLDILLRALSFWQSLFCVWVSPVRTSAGGFSTIPDVLRGGGPRIPRSTPCPS